MPKFYGKIGYAENVEIRPGVCQEQIIERNHYGEVVRNTRRLVASENLNDNINVSNEITILYDNNTTQHSANIHAMRYVEFMGAKWKIANVEVRPPRLVLTLGGLYNGKQD